PADCAGCPPGEALLPEMDAVGFRRTRHVRTMIDDHRRPPGAQLARVARNPQKLSRPDLLESELHYGRPTPNESPDQVEGRAGSGAVDDGVNASGQGAHVCTITQWCARSRAPPKELRSGRKEGRDPAQVPGSPGGRAVHQEG